MARDDILKKLDACFPPRDTRGKPRREFLLYGLGGVGKTQVALKAADNLEERYVAPSVETPRAGSYG
jgi:Cdc6-like AAA superfamily ATPase